MMHRVRGALAFIFVLLGASLVLLGGSPAFAQISQIRVICAYPAGSGADVTIRYYAEKLKEVSGATVIVDNKPGANAHLGTLALMSAKPDGQTILIHSTGAILGNPLMMAAAKYDPFTDMEVAGLLFEGSFVLVVRPDKSPNSVAELIERLKTRPDQAKYGSANASSQVSTEMFLRAKQLTALPVNYRASAEVVQDLNSDLLDFAFIDAAFGLAQAHAGRVKLLATTGSWRIPGFANVPTMQESGFPGYEYTAVFGIWLPKGTNKAMVDQYAEWIKKIGAMPETEKQLALAGAISRSTLSPSEVSAKLKRTYDEWGKVVREAGIKMQ